MSFRIEIDKASIKRMEKDIEKEQRLLEENLLSYMGTEAVSLILDRINRGIGIDDAKMKPYSEGYKKYRNKKGRNIDKRDLTFSGIMLGSMVVDGVFHDKNGSYVTINFGGGDILIRAQANEKRTPFFGISPSDKKLLDKSIKRFLNKYFGRK